MDFLTTLLPGMVSPLLAAGLVAASFFTSAMTAAFGLGGGIAMLAILGASIPAAAIIPVHGIVQLGSNAGRAWHMREHMQARRLMPFAMGIVIGGIIGGLVAVDLPEWLLRTAIGSFIIAFTWVKMPDLGVVPARFLALGGALIMFLNMIFGATGPLTSTLFQRIFDKRQHLIASVAGAMTVQNMMKTIVFGTLGFAFHEWIWLAAAMIAIGYLGTITGARFLDAIPEDRFRSVFRIVITLLALDMVRRGVSALL